MNFKLVYKNHFSRRRERKRPYDLSGAIDKFIDFQRAERKEYLEWEARRQDRENELEAKRRREDQQHELRLFQLLAGIHHHPPSFPGSFPGYPYDVGFTPEDDDDPN